MDNAVGLVDAYLRVNGFFTVTEYPILHRRQGGVLKEVTDVDILAHRLPYAGMVLPRPRSQGGHQKVPVDPLLGTQWGRAEIIVGEVKEGIGTFNPAMFRKDVIYEALRRFGAAPRPTLEPAVEQLRKEGSAVLDNGARVRLMAFGSRPPDHQGRLPHTFVPMSHVVSFLRDFVRRHDEVRAGSGFRDPVLGFLALLDKADPPPG